jgi:hypothetical protein
MKPRNQPTLDSTRERHEGGLAVASFDTGVNH